MTRITITLAATSLLALVACSDDSDTSTDGSGGQSAQTAGGNGATGGNDGGSGGAPTCAESMSTAECTSYCQAALAAGCPDSPTQAECEDQCGQLNDFVAMCPAWGGVVDCAGESPTFTCMFGEMVPEGCEEEFYCLSLCFE